jgi:hypothetical protein
VPDLVLHLRSKLDATGYYGYFEVQRVVPTDTER